MGRMEAEVEQVRGVAHEPGLKLCVKAPWMGSMVCRPG
ncbi:unnamed protein product [Ectocarpus sp. 8 AP-2014]